MVTELQQKMGGWIVELVAPALIMIMTGSLTFFLMAATYYGDYSGRVSWVLALFIFASVLTSRISIMEGFDKAIFYGMVLGAVTLFVLTTLSNMPLPLGMVFIGVIWWFNSKLTWDCTVLDNSRDTTDRGLLARFSRSSEAKSEDDTQEESEEVHGTSTDEPQKSTPWTSRLWGKKKVANTPGVWVLILSLAAFPIFGIGQGFIGDELRRQQAFFYFCTYLGAGLGLLVTTAMIGLQRYLQKRNATMPNAVAMTWVGIGALMILAILVGAWILPRPYSEYTIAENPFKFEKSSNWGPTKNPIGNEGKNTGESGGKTDSSKKSGTGGSGNAKSPNDPANKQSSKPNPSQGKQSSGKGTTGAQDNESSKSGSEGQPENGKTNGDSTDSKNSPNSGSKKGAQPDKSGGDKSGGDKSGGQKSGGQKSGGQKSGGQKSGGQKSGGQKSGGQKSGGQKSGGQKSGGQKSGGQKSGGSSGAKKQPSDAQKKSQSSGGSRRQSQTNQSSSLRMPSFGGVIWIVQVVFWVVFVIVALVLIWIYRRQIWEGILKFIDDLKAFWANLWSRKKAPNKEQELVESKRDKLRSAKPFAQFQDPFLQGTHANWKTEELVRYSFEALEAWGRERGVAREEDQTPHEFALNLVELEKNVARSAKKLADFYCSIAFAKDRLDKKMVDNELRALWSLLSERSASADLQPA